MVLAGRDVLVPLTDATITYEFGEQTVDETAETILVNRTQATWIEVDDGSGGNDGRPDRRPAEGLPRRDGEGLHRRELTLAGSALGRHPSTLNPPST